MSGVNKVILVGHLGADPEVKAISSGNTVARLSLATSESWKDREGQRQERTEWHRIVLWGKQAELAGKYLTKGRQIYVEGRLQTRSWEDPQGQKRYTTEIVANAIQFLGGGNSGLNPNRNEGGFGMNNLSNGNGGNDFPAHDFGPESKFDPDEEIPF